MRRWRILCLAYPLIRTAATLERFSLLHEHRDWPSTEAYLHWPSAHIEEIEVTLREIQEPIKTRYRDDPEAARITLRATGAMADGAMSCSVDIGRALYAAAAHPGVGGAGGAACSGDLLLGALAACAQLTCQMVAANMGLDDIDVSVTVEGDLDLRGTLGTPDVPVGFDAIRLRFAIGTAVADDQLERLKLRTERYCVVLQTLLTPPAIEASWDVPN